MDKKIILVKRKTRLEELITRYNTIEQAKFYIEHLGSDFNDYIQEDKVYKESLITSETSLSVFGRVQILDREYVPNFIFGEEDIVVAVGQDGLVANTMKYLNGQLLLGVNPDKKRWDGVLLPFIPEELKLVMKDVIIGKRQVKEVTMAKASLNDGQSMYAVNDIFIGQKTHVSSRYNIHYGEKEEYQSSSGIIVSTGLGSTGWMKSVLKGAINIVSQAFENKSYAESSLKSEWNSDCLYFSVREPFPSRTSGTDIVFGKVNSSSPLIITSQMPENGVIFSDGIEADYLQFNSGVTASIEVADKKGYLAV